MILKDKQTVTQIFSAPDMTLVGGVLQNTKFSGSYFAFALFREMLLLRNNANATKSEREH